MDTVVFIHGFPFDGSMWGPQLGALPGGWRGLAPDLRGFGAAPLSPVDGEVPSGTDLGRGVARADEPVLSMELLADDVAVLIERDAGGPAVVCGLSMGGYVALSLWRRHPELVRALVLADTRAEGDTDQGVENRRRMAQTARESGMAPIARAMVPTLLSTGTVEARPEVADHVERMIVGTPPLTVIAALAGMADRRDASGDLATLDVPVLVLVGEADGITPPEVARSLADRLPHGRLVVIPGAGHVSNLENPAAFSAALTGFLATL